MVVVPNYQAPANSPVGFFDDSSAEWSTTRSYVKGDVVYLKNNSVLIRPFNGTTNDEAVPMKTVYVCVADNTNKSPESNPSFWQRDACSKKLGACQRRFNSSESISYQKGEGVAGSFNYIEFSGLKSNSENIPINSGLFHTESNAITGHLTGDWCIMGWTHINNLSPLGAGVFSTSSRDASNWPNNRFLNINSDIKVSNNKPIPGSMGTSRGTVSANFVGPNLPANGKFADYFSANLHQQQAVDGSDGEDGKEWYHYVIVNDTSTSSVINSSASTLKIYVNGQRETKSFTMEADLANFAGFPKREAITFDVESIKAIPQTFMLGAVEQRFGTRGYEDDTAPHFATMNGGIGPWALWSRTLSEREISFLYKEITTPYNSSTSNGALHHVPREYSECTGLFSGITGDRLRAWWDGTTGEISANVTGMVDVHTGNHFLTGSGMFSSRTETYVDAAFENFSNPTPLYARFGSFPGTDGFNYGRTSTY